MKDALSDVSACGWHFAKLCAPKEVVVRESVLSEEEASRGAQRLADAAKLREERFDQLTRHAIAVHPEEEERMRVAGENAEELTAFLEKEDNPDRKKLLDSLTKKDDKDLRAEVLEDHLSAKRGSWSEDIHVQDLLCPRIWLEEIGAYRSYICSVLTAQEQEAFASNPELIWNYVNQKIAYIPEDRQTYGLILDFTLEDNLALKNYFKEPFSRKGILNKKEFETYGEKLIQAYDVRSGQGNRTQVRSMSGGNQQKAIIAREIQQDTPLLIFVQPTRGLDIGAIENIHKQILAERDKGKAILLISLELDEIMNLADTIGVIYNGQIQKIADASTLTTKEVGQFMMGVKNENDKDGREVKD